MFDMYLLTSCENFKFFFGTMALFLFFISSIFSVHIFSEKIKNRIPLYLAWFATIAMWALATLIPMQKDMIIIYTVPKIVANKDIKELPLNSVKVANEWLKSQLKKISKD